MKKSLLLLLIIASMKAYCQMDNLVLTKDSDTTFWRKNQIEKINEFQLPRLDLNSEFVFRSWNPGSLLEIEHNSGITNGRVVYFVLEVWKEDYPVEKFVREYQLPNKVADSLYAYLKTSIIYEVPSDKYIEDWKQGFDGITHIYEIKDGKKYIFKNYWTPRAQNGINEAEAIITFDNRISTIVGLKEYGQRFVAEIPFPHYKYSGEAYSILKTVSRQELRKYKRKKRNNKR